MSKKDMKELKRMVEQEPQEELMDVFKCAGINVKSIKSPKMIITEQDCPPDIFPRMETELTTEEVEIEYNGQKYSVKKELKEYIKYFNLVTNHVKGIDIEVSVKPI